MAPAAAGPLSEHEYWRMFHSVRGDVEAAIKSNYGYLRIHNLAVAERTIYDKYQRDAHFWTLVPYSLQTTFFIAFGRIFDPRSDSFSIHKLLDGMRPRNYRLTRAAAWPIAAPPPVPWV